MLLRKTDVKKVIPCYRQLLMEYPTFEDLSKADEASLTKMLLPLGIHRTRPTQLKKIAKILVEKFKGQLPDTPEDLQTSLHGLGVGRYIANSVFCLSEGRDLPMLDANSVRVIQRVFSLESLKKRPREDQRFWDFLASLIPRGRGRELNLGIIDFAAKVCTARNPRCETCRLNAICDYYESASSAKYK